ncbi:MAG TPA: carboxypeptidase regulatory-like domain-containing protein [Terriglobia bacterium]|nr:carboxypeptidase regulatory-like domain-containing protein [Terriglobia bacterium]
MIIAPSIFPVPYQTAVRHVQSGNLEQAVEIFSDQVLPLIHLFGLGDEIANTKALFKEIGIFRSDELRLPLLPCSLERRREVLLAYQGLHQARRGGRRDRNGFQLACEFQAYTFGLTPVCAQWYQGLASGKMAFNRLKGQTIREGLLLRRSSSSVVALVIALTCATALYGSLDRGIIQGTITDLRGALVSNAKVVVKNMATNVESVLTTNSDGFHLAPQLVPGQYSIQVTASGFEALGISNVTVTAGMTTTANGQLKLGSTTQRVEVTAAPPLLVEGTPSNFTTAISNTYIQNSPLPGRDIQTLVQLLPSVTQSTGPSGSLFGFDSQFGGFPDPLHIVGSAIDANGS